MSRLLLTVATAVCNRNNRMPCAMVPLLAAVALAVTAPPPLRVEVVVKDRVMTGLYKVYGSPREFPDQWLAAVVCSNQGKEKVRELQVRFRIADHVAWSEWSRPQIRRPGQELVVPYHPLFDGDIVNLQSSTPVQLDFEWKYRGPSGWVFDDATQRITLLGGREFVFSSVAGGRGTFEEAFSNAPFLAAWVSRDDPVIKQYASLVSRRGRRGGDPGDRRRPRNAEGIVRADVAERLRLQKSRRIVRHPTLVRLTARPEPQIPPRRAPRQVGDVHRIGHPPCGHRASARYRLQIGAGLRPLLPDFRAAGGERRKQEDAARAAEATGIRGGLRGHGVTRVGFDAAVEMAQATEEAAKKNGEFIEVDVAAEWGRGVSSPELPSLFRRTSSKAGASSFRESRA